MSKAEESALKVYPKMSRISEPHGVIPADNKSHYLGDANVEKREGFIEGYRQAEKDLKLTWEDIEIILDVENDILHECNSRIQLLIEMYPTGKDYYQEILKRFEDRKEAAKESYG